LSSREPTTKASWEIRSFREDDLPRLVELARIVYGDQHALTNVAYLDWKYTKNPSGKAVAAVCEQRGQIIGFTALIPQEFEINHATWCFAWGGDLMVHPQFRRQGVFVAMVQSVFRWSEGKISLVYGARELGSPTLRGLFKHFDYVNAGKVITVKKYLRTFSAIRHLWFYPKPALRNLVRYLASVADLISSVLISYIISLIDHAMGLQKKFSGKDQVIQVNEMNRLVFGEEFDSLWEDVGDSLPICVVKTKEYLNWRYANPTATYIGFRADRDGVLSGFAVLAYTIQRRLKTAWLVDLLAANPDSAARLVEECLRRARRDQAHIFKMYDMTLTKNFARSFGLLKTWYKRSLAVYIADPRIPKDLLSDIANWHVTVADIEDWI